MPSEHRGSREICRSSAGSVERALLEFFEGHVRARILMGGTGTTGGATSASSASFQRVAYRHQRLQAGEADLRHRRLVPAGFAEGRELFRDFDADHVGSGVLGAGLAAAGAIESSHPPDGARVQFLAEDVSILWHDQPHRTLHSASNRGAGRGQEAALLLPACRQRPLQLLQHHALICLPARISSTTSGASSASRRIRLL